MSKNYILAIIIILILVIHRQIVIYYLSLVTSVIICDNNKKCNGLYVKTSDVSGPANSARLGITWEPWMIFAIKKYSIPNLISLDIGAHMGTHTVSLSKFTVKVYAFEPNPPMYKILVKNTANLKNVITLPNAVGEINETVIFNVDSISSRSYIGKGTGTSINVKQIKIDDMNLCKVGFIKIDIEGGEIAAFNGMKRLLLRDRPNIVYEDHSGDNTKYLKYLGYKTKKLSRNNYVAF